MIERFLRWIFKKPWKSVESELIPVIMVDERGQHNMWHMPLNSMRTGAIATNRYSETAMEFFEKRGRDRALKEAVKICEDFAKQHRAQKRILDMCAQKIYNLKFNPLAKEPHIKR